MLKINNRDCFGRPEDGVVPNSCGLGFFNIENLFKMAIHRLCLKKKKKIFPCLYDFITLDPALEAFSMAFSSVWVKTV